AGQEAPMPRTKSLGRSAFRRFATRCHTPVGYSIGNKRFGPGAYLTVTAREAEIDAPGNARRETWRRVINSSIARSDGIIRLPNSMLPTYLSFFAVDIAPARKQYSILRRIHGPRCRPAQGGRAATGHGGGAVGRTRGTICPSRPKQRTGPPPQSPGLGSQRIGCRSG